MKTIILSLCFSIFLINATYSQCAVNITATAAGVTTHDTIEICLGQSAFLAASGTCSYLMNNNFNGSTVGAGWDVSSTPLFTNPCPPITLPAQGVVLWIGQSSYPRWLTTLPFDLSQGGCTVDWDMKYGANQNTTNCESPDENDEGVYLKYSINNGTTWTNFPGAEVPPSGVYGTSSYINGSGGYWTPVAGNAATGPYYTWNHYKNPIPSGASTVNTKIRWFQDVPTSNLFDHWGIDNVVITCSASQNFTWSNGAIGNTITVSPTVNTWYTVTITDTTQIPNLTATDSVLVVVHAVPTSDFTVITPICSDDTSILQYTGIPTSGPVYNWVIGGDTLTTIGGGGAGPISVLWNKPYNPAFSSNTISLIVENQFHCFSNSTSHSVTVNATPDVSYTQSQPSQGCAPLSVNFNDETVPTVASRIWDFGDGNTSTDPSPTHIYQTTGVFTLKLSIVTTGGCMGEYVQQNAVTVLSQPIADFTWNPPIGTRTNPTINFVNLTTPNDTAFTWSWDFGDGSNGSLKNPTHIYPSIADEKNYTVTLIATSNLGCNDTITYTNVKIIDDVLIFPNILTPNGDGINDKFEIGALLKGGAYPEMQVTIYNRWGKKVFESNNYKNDFGGEGLPDGVYYVTIKARGVIKDVEYKSSLQILR